MCAHPEQRACAGTVWWPLHSPFSKPVCFAIWIISPTCASPRTRANSEGPEGPAKDSAFLRFASHFHAANFRRPLAQQPGNPVSGFPDDRDDCRPASRFEVHTHLTPVEPDCSPDLAVGHQAFGHPRIDGPRRYLHPHRHLFLRDVIIILSKFVIHPFVRRGEAHDLRRHREERRNSKAGGEELSGSS